MSGFLALLAERALGSEAVLAPRRPSRFDPSDAWDAAPRPVPEALLAAARPDRPSAARAAQHRAGGGARDAPRQPPPGTADREQEREPAPDGRGTGDGPSTAPRDGVTGPAGREAQVRDGAAPPTGGDVDAGVHLDVDLAVDPAVDLDLDVDLDVEDTVREHVVPVLVERRLLDPGAPPLVTRDSSRPVPTTEPVVRVGQVRTGSRPGTPHVHVSIDRVEVLHPAPPPPQRPPPAPVPPPPELPPRRGPEPLALGDYLRARREGSR